MNNNIIEQINFVNETVLSYDIVNTKRAKLEAELFNIKSSIIDIPLIIGGKEIRTNNKCVCILPHNKNKIIGKYHKAGKEEVEIAIKEALNAKEK